MDFIDYYMYIWWLMSQTSGIKIYSLHYDDIQSLCYLQLPLHFKLPHRKLDENKKILTRHWSVYFHQSYMSLSQCKNVRFLRFSLFSTDIHYQKELGGTIFHLLPLHPPHPRPPRCWSWGQCWSALSSAGRPGQPPGLRTGGGSQRSARPGGRIKLHNSGHLSSVEEVKTLICFSFLFSPLPPPK